MPRGSLSRPFVVIGGGVVGLSAARELASRGARVTLVDRREGSRGGEATRASLGVLGAPRAGRTPLARLSSLAHRGYPALARELAEETGVDVGYRVAGSLRLSRELPGAAARSRAERAYLSAGVRARWVEGAELANLARGLAAAFPAGLLVEDEAIVHPVELARALGASCERRGVEMRLDAGPARLGPGGEVEIEGGEVISGAAVIVAAGSWTPEVLGAAAPGTVPPLKPIRGQAIELRRAWTGPNLRFPGPRHGRDRSDGNMEYHLVGQGGAAWVGSTVEDAGFDARVTDKGIAELIEAARQVLPAPEVPVITRAWAGLRPKALRPGGPFLGKLAGPGEVWIACGHYRSGILLGPASARLLVEAIARDDGTPGPDAIDPESWAAFRP